MKQCLVILSLLLTITAAAQKEKIKHVRLQNRPLQQFIISSGILHHAEFKMEYQGRLKIKPDTLLAAVKDLVPQNWYSPVYKGHQYLLEKYYGHFPEQVLRSLLDSLLAGECEYPNFSGTVYKDHIEVKISTSCPSRNGENFYFISTDRGEPAFMGGPAALTQLVAAKLACLPAFNIPASDSAQFLYAIVKKDSIAHEITLLQPGTSVSGDLLKKALTNTTGWKPYEKDGRYMNAYLQVFVCFRKDGTIEADYLH